jgi:hypothetical protein
MSDAIQSFTAKITQKLAVDSFKSDQSIYPYSLIKRISFRVVEGLAL